jgi:hypothetical protein
MQSITNLAVEDVMQMCLNEVRGHCTVNCSNYNYLLKTTIEAVVSSEVLIAWPVEARFWIEVNDDVANQLLSAP